MWKQYNFFKNGMRGGLEDNAFFMVWDFIESWIFQNYWTTLVFIVFLGIIFEMALIKLWTSFQKKPAISKKKSSHTQKNEDRCLQCGRLGNWLISCPSLQERIDIFSETTIISSLICEENESTFEDRISFSDDVISDNNSENGYQSSHLSESHMPSSYETISPLPLIHSEIKESFQRHRESPEKKGQTVQFSSKKLFSIMKTSKQKNVKCPTDLYFSRTPRLAVQNERPDVTPCPLVHLYLSRDQVRILEENVRSRTLLKVKAILKSKYTSRSQACLIHDQKSVRMSISTPSQDPCLGQNAIDNPFQQLVQNEESINSQSAVKVRFLPQPQNLMKKPTPSSTQASFQVRGMARSQHLIKVPYSVETQNSIQSRVSDKEDLEEAQYSVWFEDSNKNKYLVKGQNAILKNAGFLVLTPSPNTFADEKIQLKGIKPDGMQQVTSSKANQDSVHSLVSLSPTIKGQKNRRKTSKSKNKLSHKVPSLKAKKTSGSRVFQVTGHHTLKNTKELGSNSNTEMKGLHKNEDISDLALHLICVSKFVPPNMKKSFRKKLVNVIPDLTKCRHFFWKENNSPDTEKINYANSTEYSGISGIIKNVKQRGTGNEKQRSMSPKIPPQLKQSFKFNTYQSKTPGNLVMKPAWENKKSPENLIGIADLHAPNSKTFDLSIPKHEVSLKEAVSEPMQKFLSSSKMESKVLEDLENTDNAHVQLLQGENFLTSTSEMQSCFPNGNIQAQKEHFKIAVESSDTNLSMSLRTKRHKNSSKLADVKIPLNTEDVIQKEKKHADYDNLSLGEEMECDARSNMKNMDEKETADTSQNATYTTIPEPSHLEVPNRTKSEKNTSGIIKPSHSTPEQEKSTDEKKRYDVKYIDKEFIRDMFKNLQKWNRDLQQWNRKKQETLEDPETQSTQGFTMSNQQLKKVKSEIEAGSLETEKNPKKEQARRVQTLCTKSISGSGPCPAGDPLKVERLMQSTNRHASKGHTAEPKNPLALSENFSVRELLIDPTKCGVGFNGNPRKSPDDQTAKKGEIFERILPKLQNEGSKETLPGLVSRDSCHLRFDACPVKELKIEKEMNQKIPFTETTVESTYSSIMNAFPVKNMQKSPTAPAYVKYTEDSKIYPWMLGKPPTGEPLSQTRQSDVPDTGPPKREIGYHSSDKTELPKDLLTTFPETSDFSILGLSHSKGQKQRRRLAHKKRILRSKYVPVKTRKLPVSQKRIIASHGFGHRKQLGSNFKTKDKMKNQGEELVDDSASTVYCPMHDRSEAEINRSCLVCLKQRELADKERSKLADSFEQSNVFIGRAEKTPDGEEEEQNDLPATTPQLTQHLRSDACQMKEMHLALNYLTPKMPIYGEDAQCQTGFQQMVLEASPIMDSREVEELQKPNKPEYDVQVPLGPEFPSPKSGESQLSTLLETRTECYLPPSGNHQRERDSYFVEGYSELPKDLPLTPSQYSDPLKPFVSESKRQKHTVARMPTAMRCKCTVMKSKKPAALRLFNGSYSKLCHLSMKTKNPPQSKIVEDVPLDATHSTVSILPNSERSSSLNETDGQMRSVARLAHNQVSQDKAPAGRKIWPLDSINMGSIFSHIKYGKEEGEKHDVLPAPEDNQQFRYSANKEKDRGLVKSEEEVNQLGRTQVETQSTRTNLDSISHPTVSTFPMENLEKCTNIFLPQKSEESMAEVIPSARKYSVTSVGNHPKGQDSDTEKKRAVTCDDVCIPTSSAPQKEKDIKPFSDMKPSVTPKRVIVEAKKPFNLYTFNIKGDASSDPRKELRSNLITKMKETQPDEKMVDSISPFITIMPDISMLCKKEERSMLGGEKLSSTKGEQGIRSHEANITWDDTKETKQDDEEEEQEQEALINVIPQHGQHFIFHSQQEKKLDLHKAAKRRSNKILFVTEQDVSPQMQPSDSVPFDEAEEILQKQIDAIHAMGSVHPPPASEGPQKSGEVFTDAMKCDASSDTSKKEKAELNCLQPTVLKSLNFTHSDLPESERKTTQCIDLKRKLSLQCVTLKAKKAPISHILNIPKYGPQKPSRKTLKSHTVEGGVHKEDSEIPSDEIHIRVPEDPSARTKEESALELLKTVLECLDVSVLALLASKRNRNCFQLINKREEMSSKCPTLKVKRAPVSCGTSNYKRQLEHNFKAMLKQGTLTADVFEKAFSSPVLVSQGMKIHKEVKVEADLLCETKPRHELEQQEQEASSEERAWWMDSSHKKGSISHDTKEGKDQGREEEKAEQLIDAVPSNSQCFSLNVHKMEEPNLLKSDLGLKHSTSEKSPESLTVLQGRQPKTAVTQKLLKDISFSILDSFPVEILQKREKPQGSLKNIRSLTPEKSISKVLNVTTKDSIPFERDPRKELASSHSEEKIKLQRDLRVRTAEPFDFPMPVLSESKGQKNITQLSAQKGIMSTKCETWKSQKLPCPQILSVTRRGHPKHEKNQSSNSEVKMKEMQQRKSLPEGFLNAHASPVLTVVKTCSSIDTETDPLKEVRSSIEPYAYSMDKSSTVNDRGAEVQEKKEDKALEGTLLCCTQQATSSGYQQKMSDLVKWDADLNRSGNQNNQELVVTEQMVPPQTTILETSSSPLKVLFPVKIPEKTKTQTHIVDSKIPSRTLSDSSNSVLLHNKPDKPCEVIHRWELDGHTVEGKAGMPVLESFDFSGPILHESQGQKKTPHASRDAPVEAEMQPILEMIKMSNCSALSQRKEQQCKFETIVQHIAESISNILMNSYVLSTSVSTGIKMHNKGKAEKDLLRETNNISQLKQDEEKRFCVNFSDKWITISNNTSEARQQDEEPKKNKDGLFDISLMFPEDKGSRNDQNTSTTKREAQQPTLVSENTLQCNCFPTMTPFHSEKLKNNYSPQNCIVCTEGAKILRQNLGKAVVSHPSINKAKHRTMFAENPTSNLNFCNAVSMQPERGEEIRKPHNLIKFTANRNILPAKLGSAVLRDSCDEIIARKPNSHFGKINEGLHKDLITAAIASIFSDSEKQKKVLQFPKSRDIITSKYVPMKPKRHLCSKMLNITNNCKMHYRKKQEHSLQSSIKDMQQNESIPPLLLTLTPVSTEKSVDIKMPSGSKVETDKRKVRLYNFAHLESEQSTHDGEAWKVELTDMQNTSSNITEVNLQHEEEERNMRGSLAESVSYLSSFGCQKKNCARQESYMNRSKDEKTQNLFCAIPKMTSKENCEKSVLGPFCRNMMNFLQAEPMEEGEIKFMEDLRTSFANEGKSELGLMMYNTPWDVTPRRKCPISEKRALNKKDLLPTVFISSDVFILDPSEAKRQSHPEIVSKKDIIGPKHVTLKAKKLPVSQFMNFTRCYRGYCRKKTQHQFRYTVKGRQQNAGVGEASLSASLPGKSVSLDVKTATESKVLRDIPEVDITSDHWLKQNTSSTEGEVWPKESIANKYVLRITTEAKVQDDKKVKMDQDALAYEGGDTLQMPIVKERGKVEKLIKHGENPKSSSLKPEKAMIRELPGDTSKCTAYYDENSKMSMDSQIIEGKSGFQKGLPEVILELFRLSMPILSERIKQRQLVQLQNVKRTVSYKHLTLKTKKLPILQSFHTTSPSTRKNLKCKYKYNTKQASPVKYEADASYCYSMTLPLTTDVEKKLKAEVEMESETISLTQIKQKESDDKKTRDTHSSDKRRSSRDVTKKAFEEKEYQEIIAKEIPPYMQSLIPDYYQIKKHGLVKLKNSFPGKRNNCNFPVKEGDVQQQTSLPEMILDSTAYHIMNLFQVKKMKERHQMQKVTDSVKIPPPKLVIDKLSLDTIERDIEPKGTYPKNLGSHMAEEKTELLEHLETSFLKPLDFFTPILCDSKSQINHVQLSEKKIILNPKCLTLKEKKSPFSQIIKIRRPLPSKHRVKLASTLKHKMKEVLSGTNAADTFPNSIYLTLDTLAIKKQSRFKTDRGTGTVSRPPPCVESPPQEISRHSDSVMKEDPAILLKEAKLHDEESEIRKKEHLIKMHAVPTKTFMVNTCLVKEPDPDKSESNNSDESFLPNIDINKENLGKNVELEKSKNATENLKMRHLSMEKSEGYSELRRSSEDVAPSLVDKKIMRNSVLQEKVQHGKLAAIILDSFSRHLPTLQKIKRQNDILKIASLSSASSKSGHLRGKQSLATKSHGTQNPKKKQEHNFKGQNKEGEKETAVPGTLLHSVCPSMFTSPNMEMEQSPGLWGICSKSSDESNVLTKAKVQEREKCDQQVLHRTASQYTQTFGTGQKKEIGPFKFDVPYINTVCPKGITPQKTEIDLKEQQRKIKFVNEISPKSGFSSEICLLQTEQQKMESETACCQIKEDPKAKKLITDTHFLNTIGYGGSLQHREEKEGKSHLTLKKKQQNPDILGNNWDSVYANTPLYSEMTSPIDKAKMADVKNIMHNEQMKLKTKKAPLFHLLNITKHDMKESNNRLRYHKQEKLSQKGEHVTNLVRKVIHESECLTSQAQKLIETIKTERDKCKEEVHIFPQRKLEKPLNGRQALSSGSANTSNNNKTTSQQLRPNIHQIKQCRRVKVDLQRRMCSEPVSQQRAFNSAALDSQGSRRGREVFVPGQEAQQQNSFLQQEMQKLEIVPNTNLDSIPCPTKETFNLKNIVEIRPKQFSIPQKKDSMLTNSLSCFGDMQFLISGVKTQQQKPFTGSILEPRSSHVWAQLYIEKPKEEINTKPLILKSSGQQAEEISNEAFMSTIGHEDKRLGTVKCTMYPKKVKMKAKKTLVFQLLYVTGSGIQSAKKELRFSMKRQQKESQQRENAADVILKMTYDFEYVPSHIKKLKKVIRENGKKKNLMLFTPPLKEKSSLAERKILPSEPIYKSDILHMIKKAKQHIGKQKGKNQTLLLNILPPLRHGFMISKLKRRSNPVKLAADLEGKGYPNPASQKRESNYAFFDDPNIELDVLNKQKVKENDADIAKQIYVVPRAREGAEKSVIFLNSKEQDMPSTEMDTSQDKSCKEQELFKKECVSAANLKAVTCPSWQPLPFENIEQVTKEERVYTNRRDIFQPLGNKGSKDTDSLPGSKGQYFLDTNVGVHQKISVVQEEVVKSDHLPEKSFNSVSFPSQELHRLKQAIKAKERENVSISRNINVDPRQKERFKLTNISLNSNSQKRNFSKTLGAKSPNLPRDSTLQSVSSDQLDTFCFKKLEEKVPTKETGSEVLSPKLGQTLSISAIPVAQPLCNAGNNLHNRREDYQQCTCRPHPMPISPSSVDTHQIKAPYITNSMAEDSRVYHISNTEEIGFLVAEKEEEQSENIHQLSPKPSSDSLIATLQNQIPYVKNVLEEILCMVDCTSTVEGTGLLYERKVERQTESIYQTCAKPASKSSTDKFKNQISKEVTSILDHTLNTEEIGKRQSKSVKIIIPKSVYHHPGKDRAQNQTSCTKKASGERNSVMSYKPNTEGIVILPKNQEKKAQKCNDEPDVALTKPSAALPSRPPIKLDKEIQLDEEIFKITDSVSHTISNTREIRYTKSIHGDITKDIKNATQNMPQEEKRDREEAVDVRETKHPIAITRKTQKSPPSNMLHRTELYLNIRSQRKNKQETQAKPSHIVLRKMPTSEPSPPDSKVDKGTQVDKEMLEIRKSLQLPLIPSASPSGKKRGKIQATDGTREKEKEYTAQQAAYKLKATEMGMKMHCKSPKTSPILHMLNTRELVVNIRQAEGNGHKGKGEQCVILTKTLLSRPLSLDSGSKMPFDTPKITEVSLPLQNHQESSDTQKLAKRKPVDGDSQSSLEKIDHQAPQEEPMQQCTLNFLIGVQQSKECLRVKSKGNLNQFISNSQKGLYFTGVGSIRSRKSLGWLYTEEKPRPQNYKTETRSSYLSCPTIGPNKIGNLKEGTDTMNNFSHKMHPKVWGPLSREISSTPIYSKGQGLSASKQDIFSKATSESVDSYKFLKPKWHVHSNNKRSKMFSHVPASSKTESSEKMHVREMTIPQNIEEEMTKQAVPQSKSEHQNMTNSIISLKFSLQIGKQKTVLETDLERKTVLPRRGLRLPDTQDLTQVAETAGEESAWLASELVKCILELFQKSLIPHLDLLLHSRDMEGESGNDTSTTINMEQKILEMDNKSTVSQVEETVNIDRSNTVHPKKGTLKVPKNRNIVDLQKDKMKLGTSHTGNMDTPSLKAEGSQMKTKAVVRFVDNRPIKQTDETELTAWNAKHNTEPRKDSKKPVLDSCDSFVPFSTKCESHKGRLTIRDMTRGLKPNYSRTNARCHPVSQRLSTIGRSAAKNRKKLEYNLDKQKQMTLWYRDILEIVIRSLSISMASPPHVKEAGKSAKNLKRVRGHYLFKSQEKSPNAGKIGTSSTSKVGEQNSTKKIPGQCQPFTGAEEPYKTFLSADLKPKLYDEISKTNFTLQPEQVIPVHGALKIIKEPDLQEPKEYMDTHINSTTCMNTSPLDIGKSQSGKHVFDIERRTSSPKQTDPKEPVQVMTQKVEQQKALSDTIPVCMHAHVPIPSQMKSNDIKTWAESTGTESSPPVYEDSENVLVTQGENVMAERNQPRGNQGGKALEKQAFACMKIKDQISVHQLEKVRDYIPDDLKSPFPKRHPELQSKPFSAFTSEEKNKLTNHVGSKGLEIKRSLLPEIVNKSFQYFNTYSKQSISEEGSSLGMYTKPKTVCFVSLEGIDTIELNLKQKNSPINRMKTLTVNVPRCNEETLKLKNTDKVLLSEKSSKTPADNTKLSHHILQNFLEEEKAKFLRHFSTKAWEIQIQTFPRVVIESFAVANGRDQAKHLSQCIHSGIKSSNEILLFFEEKCLHKIDLDLQYKYLCFLLGLTAESIPPKRKALSNHELNIRTMCGKVDDVGKSCDHPVDTEQFEDQISLKKPSPHRSSSLTTLCPEPTQMGTSDSDLTSPVVKDPSVASKSKSHVTPEKDKECNFSFEKANKYKSFDLMTQEYISLTDGSSVHISESGTEIQSYVESVAKFEKCPSLKVYESKEYVYFDSSPYLCLEPESFLVEPQEGIPLGTLCQMKNNKTDSKQFYGADTGSQDIRGRKDILTVPSPHYKPYKNKNYSASSKRDSSGWFLHDSPNTTKIQSVASVPFGEETLSWTTRNKTSHSLAPLIESNIQLHLAENQGKHHVRSGSKGRKKPEFGAPRKNIVHWKDDYSYTMSKEKRLRNKKMYEFESSKWHFQDRHTSPSTAQQKYTKLHPATKQSRPFFYACTPADSLEIIPHTIRWPVPTKILNKRNFRIPLVAKMSNSWKILNLSRKWLGSFTVL
ncbi:PREDICTED: uncharacterized protein LOC102856643 [Elephantulus edwardii]|uniref:uncharacterized protein LOC102856643 n=1 Tax=Elephantulus edwardii TaxID=28737 RepID=UPI0003F07520|nr:PREDICTED: uncharacterized protein LOC102856643 [Elephantulus edwardii]